jgi:hypothetical protein
VKTERVFQVSPIASGPRLHSESQEGNFFDRGQYVNEPGGLLARRSHQRGNLLTRVIKPNDGSQSRTVWIGRWREDEIVDARTRRIRRSEVPGEKKEGDLPTPALSRRRLEERLAVVNDPTYRARPSSTFAEFARRWESLVAIQHKPSTQANLRSHLRRYITPFFGRLMVRDVRPDMVQQFVSGIKANLTEPRRAPPKVHRDVASESEWPVICLPERNSLRPEPTREAEATPAPR